jgi:hypothetical protein
MNCSVSYHIIIDIKTMAIKGRVLFQIREIGGLVLVVSWDVILPSSFDFFELFLLVPSSSSCISFFLVPMKENEWY